MTDATYGRRFLAALRKELKSTAGIPYATLAAIEEADRDGLIAILRDFRRPTGAEAPLEAVGMPPLSLREDLVRRAGTAEPEELVHAFLAALRDLHGRQVSRDLLTHAALGVFSGIVGD